MTESPGSGAVAACRRPPRPRSRRPGAERRDDLRPESSSSGDADVANVGELDVGPAQSRHLAAAQRPRERATPRSRRRRGRGARPSRRARCPRPVRRGRPQVASTAAHSSAVRPRAWPRRAGASAAAERRKPSMAWPVSGPAGVACGAPHGGDSQRGGCRRAVGLVQIQIRGEARIVQPPAVARRRAGREPRRCTTSFATPGSTSDELGRGLGAGAVRGRERAGCAAAGGHVVRSVLCLRLRL